MNEKMRPKSGLEQKVDLHWTKTGLQQDGILTKYRPNWTKCREQEQIKKGT